ncbi:prepilin-type N-terminal cleavage/methylation domain-containing protein [Nesterenkonia muleiensis]|uniref:type IV pilin protein n=1 Tax=Nesterenkonia muleiensis TaxID=2282648 RepID=UPI000E7119A5
MKITKYGKLGTVAASPASTRANRKRQASFGFTIVELMIVIVVIAILAAISIVAYTGVQGRTYDTTVQSDLRGFANQLEMFRAATGSIQCASTSLRGSLNVK